MPIFYLKRGFAALTGIAFFGITTPQGRTQMPDVLIPASAATPSSTPVNSLIEFGDGLSLSLPAGWKPTTLATGAAMNTPDASFENPDSIVLLLHARPADPKNTAMLTVLRDETFGGHAGPMARQEFLKRLGEMAAGQGFRAGKYTDKGRPINPNNVLLGQVNGVSGNGQHRIFTCVALNRFPKASLRLYWQWDESDVAARQEFDNCLASMVFDGVKVTEVLDGRAQPGAVNGLATVAGTPGSFFGTVEQTAGAIPAPSLPSKETGDLVNKNREALVVVEGDKGKGSGFICNIDGKNWLLTNAHVLSGNPHPRFNTMNGGKLTVGATSLAVDHDLCRMESTSSTTALEVLTDMDATARIGDPIVVLGNAEGAGVIRPFEGHIVGLGPNLVEVDAPFVPGNSGSPIIHQPTGKVIGIATYLITRKVDTTGKGTVETAIRRFGYRLDNVKAWEPVNWARFQTQADQVETIESTGEEFVKLFAAAHEKKLFSSSFSNPGIQRAVQTYKNRVQLGRLSQADLDSAHRELLASLRSAALADINAFDMRNAYDYFRRTVAEEKKFRDDIYIGFTRVLNSQSR